MGKIIILFDELIYLFYSYIDQVSLVMRTKTDSEILDDATLVYWYSLDGYTYHDSGALGLIGTAVDVTFVKNE
jgi:hypothetical protein